MWLFGRRAKAPGCAKVSVFHKKIMTTPRRAPKRFAPLDPTRPNPHGASKLRGIVFDVDGTLCKPQSYMFKQMREALQIDSSTDILDHVHSLPEPAQSSAQAAIRAIESEAMLHQEAQPGLTKLFDYLERERPQELRLGICTRNFDGPVQHLLKNFLPERKIAPVVTRDFRPPKPDPAGILHIAKSWGFENGGNDLIMVGDSVDDMVAGHRAGAATVLLANEANASLKEHECTGAWIDRLDDLAGLLEQGFSEREK